MSYLVHKQAKNYDADVVGGQQAFSVKGSYAARSYKPVPDPWSGCSPVGRKY